MKNSTRISVRRINELETIAHKGSIKTATALVQTFQDRMRTSPTEPGTLRIAKCYATISHEIPSSKTIAQFALWSSVTRYADKWAKYCIYNFPGWSPTVDHDGRVVVKCTNKVFTNMVPGENDAN